MPVFARTSRRKETMRACPTCGQLLRRLALSETARDKLAHVVAEVLIAIIVVCVVIVILALLKQGPSIPRTNPTTGISTTPSGGYKNCTEAHKDGRWNIPEGDPAYRPALYKDHNGVACESRDR